MKILHTADWHLGKNLEGHSRLDEQEEFLEDIIKIVNDEKVDLVIIAGDIYDTSNPPARAEKLFYSGKYKDSLDTSIKVTSLVDENIYRKLLSVYDK